MSVTCLLCVWELSEGSGVRNESTEPRHHICPSEGSGVLPQTPQMLSDSLRDLLMPELMPSDQHHRVSRL